MNVELLISAEFWEGDEHFVAGEREGDVPELEGCGGSVLFRTSGTTSEAKWVVLEKRAMIVSANAVNEWLGVGAGSKWGIALTLDHVGGFSILARVYAAGCGFAVFPGKWNAREYVRWVLREGVTHTSLVPTQVHDLVEAGMEAPRCLSAVVVGGGRLDERLGQGARDMGWPVLASYGMTETCSQIATQSMDCLGCPMLEGRLEILPIWEVSEKEGLLVISGEALFSGIIERGFFVKRAENSFRTNDRVEIDGREIRVLGRADSLVKTMGILVDLEIISGRFLEIAGGRIGAGKFVIVALPDARKENVVVVVFEGEDRRECVDEYNLQAAGIERIAESHVVKEFPRSELGKIKRGELARMILKSGGSF